ncbi:MAG: amidohydrolase [Lachnospiraceae bacterium]|nr:amidohydrolase [Lachnospiraceae bacterium]
MYERYAGLVNKNKRIIYDTIDYIWENPELGYKEWKTSEYLAEKFEMLGYSVKRADDIPGFAAELDTGIPGPKVAVMGELDAIRCATHPAANPETQAVHACGHHIQTAAMLGIAAAFKEAGATEGLCGSIRFIAVPAEETIDLGYRESLISNGIISYVAGKTEFLKRGYFDDVDMAMMFHADSGENGLFRFIDGQNGCVTKHFEYRGKAAHAGAAPHKGINALYAASIGLAACNSLRETFRERDYIRYHPIINQGGVAANAIPDIVSMDTYVRAASFDAMIEANRKINRAIAASAVSLGANVRIMDKPGNFPFLSDKNLSERAAAVIEELFGQDKIEYSGWDTQSSDVGDISSLMPVIQHYCKGASGEQHGNNYFIKDRDKTAINSAIVISCLIYDILKENGTFGRKVIAEYTPVFKSREEYFEAINKISCDMNLVEYSGNHEAKIYF